jgi:glutamine synthetase
MKLQKDKNKVDFKYDEGLITIDRTVTIKMIIKVIAAKNGYVATFMPKPFYGVNGSGMYIHQSLWSLDLKTNLCYSEDEDKVFF